MPLWTLYRFAFIHFTTIFVLIEVLTFIDLLLYGCISKVKVRIRMYASIINGHAPHAEKKNLK